MNKLCLPLVIRHNMHINIMSLKLLLFCIRYAFRINFTCVLNEKSPTTNVMPRFIIFNMYMESRHPIFDAGRSYQILIKYLDFLQNHFFSGSFSIQAIDNFMVNSRCFLNQTKCKINEYS